MRAKLVVCALVFIVGCNDRPASEPPPKTSPRHERAEAELRAKVEAEALAAQRVQEAKEMQATIERLEQEATDLQKRITEATDAIVGAQSDADREAAKAKLDALAREKATLDARVAEAKANAARAERARGVTITKECLENPLAKGCG